MNAILLAIQAKRQTKMNVGITEAANRLSALINQAAAGEEVVITKDNSAFQLVPKAAYSKDKTFPFSCMPGIQIADDFDEFGPELQEMFGMKESANAASIE